MAQPEDAEVKQIVTAYEARLVKRMDEVIGYAPQRLRRDALAATDKTNG